MTDRSPASDARDPAPRAGARRWRRRVAIVGGLLLVAAIAATWWRHSLARPPDVIFILVDTLRSDRLGAYGSRSTARTPVIDALAAESIVYERAYAPSSWTLPSVASLFLGRRPHEHGVLQFLTRLPKDGPTLAEVFHDAGWGTAAFIANTALGAFTGHDRGFEEFHVLESPDLASNPTAYVDAQGVSARTRAWLDARPPGNRPLFLYVHFMDPHAPYAVHPGLTSPRDPRLALSDQELNLRALFGSRIADGARRAAYWGLSTAQRTRMGLLYDGEVSFLDEQLGALLADLRERGILEHAIVVLTADHGEELGEHALYGHGITLFEPEIRVPLIVKLPGGPRGARVRETVETVGIGATLLRELGIARPPQFTAEPLPLPHESDRFTDVAQSEMEPVVGVQVAPHRRVRVEGTRKAFETTDGKLLVTDLATDASEVAIHAPSAPAELAMVASLKEAAAPASRRGPRTSVTLDADTRRRLEALGYVVPDAAAPDRTGRPAATTR